PLAARILAVADSFEAMTAERSYRARMTKDQAIAELRRCSGTQFDPRVVDAFLMVLTNPPGWLRAPRHYLTVVAHETDLFTVDWTASQLGYSAFPLIQRQADDGTWAKSL
ncbi:MAG TPA: HD domain-containing phosphohydrolase, partial [Thermoleophilia bacterium]|nr:HD domain-containing phosphohydrolase [Thermoleophilia bacterium]